jgi:hypothetical protein
MHTLKLSRSPIGHTNLRLRPLSRQDTNQMNEVVVALEHPLPKPNGLIPADANESTVEVYPESESAEPSYRVRFAPVKHDGMMVGFALKRAKDAPSGTKRLLSNIICHPPTTGYETDTSLGGFWRFVYPRAIDDDRWRELMSIMSETAKDFQIGLEFIDWEPTSEITHLLDQPGPRFDLDTRLRELGQGLASTAEPAEIEETPAASGRIDEDARDAKSEGYTRIPNEVLDDARLTVGARLLYGLLLRHAYGKDYCFPSQKRLATLMGVSDKWLRTYLRELEAANLVKTERKDRTRHNRYYLQRLVTA